MTHEHVQPPTHDTPEAWEGDPALEAMLDEALTPMCDEASQAALSSRIVAATTQALLQRRQSHAAAGAETPTVIGRIGFFHNATAWRSVAAVVIASGVLAAAWFGASPKESPRGEAGFAALEAGLVDMEAEVVVVSEIGPDLLDGEINTLELQVAMAQPVSFWDDAPASMDDVIDQVETDLLSGSWDRVF